MQWYWLAYGRRRGRTSSRNPTSNGARPTGEFGRPTHLVDGGGVRHAITACGDYVGCLAGTTDVVQISDVCYSPSFQADVLSVGVLRRSGTVAKFGKKPRLVTKSGNVVPLRTMGGLFYLDLVDGLPPAQTMTARATGSGVSYVEMFAGRGAMAKAAQNCGGNVVLLVENEEVAVDNLQRDFPNATILRDFDGGEWQAVERGSGPLGLLAGPSCKPFAAMGKGLGLADFRARHLLGLPDVAIHFQPETVDIEMVLGIMTREGGSALAALDAAFAKAHYRRLVPAGLPPGETAEVVHCHDLGSAVYRTRLALHYERDDVARALPSQPCFALNVIVVPNEDHTVPRPVQQNDPPRHSSDAAGGPGAPTPIPLTPLPTST